LGILLRRLFSLKEKIMTASATALDIVDHVNITYGLDFPAASALVRHITRAIEQAERQQKLKCLAEEKTILVQISEVLKPGVTL
jgi:hypothetical protein